MSGLYYDELSVGLVIEHAGSRTVTETDNTLFTAMTMNPQPLHLDEEFARQSEFGQRIVNSLFTLGLVTGLSVPELTLGTTVANLGFSDIRFPAPVFHGDTIRVQSEVIALRPSQSRPGQGVATFEHRGFNQNRVLVVSAQRTALMFRKPLGANLRGQP